MNRDKYYAQDPDCGCWMHRSPLKCIINPRYFRKSQNKLAKEQRKLSHCIKGSNNYKKQKLKVALVH